MQEAKSYKVAGSWVQDKLKAILVVFRHSIQLKLV